MSTVLTSPLTQLTFTWPELDNSPAVATRSTPVIRVPAPATRVVPSANPPSVLAAASETGWTSAASPVVREEKRLGKTSHISDLLLVVLDRYGINPDEFMKGLD
jgi:hypothetical protein